MPTPSIRNKIADYQATRQGRGDGQVPKHQPKMLYIGCVDARVSTEHGIGLGEGDALIERIIAAYVPPYVEPDETLPPAASAIAAPIEFFLNAFLNPTDAEGNPEPKTIVVSGHTSCGGLHACRTQQFPPNSKHLENYIHLLDDVREAVLSEAQEKGWNEAQTVVALERRSVRQSIENLMTYPSVLQAVEKGDVVLEGWIHDIKDEKILIMDPQTHEFSPMEIPPMARMQAGNQRKGAIGH